MPDEGATATGDGRDESPSDDVRDLRQLADDVLPALVARFSASELGELEVRRNRWRVRLRRDGRQTPAGQQPDSRRARSGTSQTQAPRDGAPSAVNASRAMVTSPAVGYYQPINGLEVGRQVRSGDVVGHVDVLGIRHDVVAGGDGVVGRVLAEPGQAVEFGQEVVRVDRLAAVPRPTGSPPDEVPA